MSESLDSLTQMQADFSRAIDNMGKALVAWSERVIPPFVAASQKLYAVVWGAYVADLPPGVEPSQEGFEMWLKRQGEELRRRQESEYKAARARGIEQIRRSIAKDEKIADES